MLYQVKKQFGRNAETLVQSFMKLDEAKQFMQSCAEADAGMKIAVVYRLYDDLEAIIQEMDTTNMPTSTSPNESSGGSQGQGKAASFRPTPFNMTLAPKGTVPKWVKDEGEGEDKDK